MSLVQSALKAAFNGSAGSREREELDRLNGRDRYQEKKKRKHSPRQATTYSMFRWTVEEEDRLECLAKSLEGPVIAQRMGRSYNSIKTKASKLGIKLIAVRGKRYRIWSTKEIAKVGEMRRSGMTVTQIANTMGMTSNQIRGAIGRAKVGPTERIRWNDDHDMAVAMYLRKGTEELLSAALGRKVSAIRSRAIALSNKRSLVAMRKRHDFFDVVMSYCNANDIALPDRNV